MENFSTAILTLLCSSAAWAIFCRYLGSKTRVDLQALEQQVRDLEKAIHLKERDFLDERNHLELAQRDKLKQECAQAFEEGHALGRSEREKDHIIDVTNLKSEHAATLIREKEATASETADRVRREFEIQNKMFSVSVRPYVKISKEDSFFNAKYVTETGYQYQLLINGIPAFQPHVVIESSEKTSQFKEDNVKFLIEKAAEAAKIAVQLKMGGNGQYVKFASAVVENALS